MKKHHTILFTTLVLLVSCASRKPAVSVTKTDSAVPRSQATDLKTTNNLDHSNAFVTVTFRGLAVLCVNEQRHGEVGILKNEHHKLIVEVKKITSKGVSKINYPIDTEHNIRIEAINPVMKGVTTYANTDVKFDKDTDQGDPEDFRWVIDLEGKDFHDSKLAIANPALLKPVFYIADGVFYTLKKTADMQGRVTWESDYPWHFVGKVADTIAADIYLNKKGAEVVLRSDVKGSEPLRLKRESGVRYEIAVSNERHSSTAMGDRSDFSYWYDVFRDDAGRKYDLRRVEEFDITGEATSLPPASRRFLSYGPGGRGRYLDTPPQNCLAIYMSKMMGFMK